MTTPTTIDGRPVLAGAAQPVVIVSGNPQGGNPVPVAVLNQISNLLDLIGSTRGSILYRGANGWAIKAPGTAGQVLQTNGPGADPTWETPSAGTSISYAILADQKPVGTGSGTLVSGAWQQRPLNTEVTDPDGIVSLSSNQFTLGTGTYLIIALAPGYGCQEMKARLYNITDSSLVRESDTSYGGLGGAESQGVCTIFTALTVSGSKTFEVQHQCRVNGEFGINTSSVLAVPPQNETYGQVFILKIS